jgi:hypothetical protein
MFKSAITFILLSGFFSFVRAQEGIGYFHDYTNHLNVFEKGGASDIESGPVRNIQTGLDYLAYVNESNSLVLYYDHQKKTIEEFPPAQIIATPYFLVYKTQQRLMICEKGEKKLLSGSAGNFYANDSIVIWQSLVTFNMMAYYKGKINVFEFSTSSNVINDGKAGPNIFAFSEADYDFKIYFNDTVYETGSSRVINYQCGRDIVAFTDVYANTFNVFYNGKTQELSNKIIKDFKVCNEAVAFVDADNNFCIFYKGTLTKIDSYAPDYYYVKNNVIYYSYNSVLRMIYNGKISKDQYAQPFEIMAGFNSLLYSTAGTNIPRFFYKGKIISNFYVPRPYTMGLSGDLPVFRYDKTIAFLYDGRLYEYGNWHD